MERKIFLVSIGSLIHSNIRSTEVGEDFIESVRHNGVLAPIHVTKSAGKWLIVNGHRRATAAKAAGIDKVPAIEIEEKDIEAFRTADSHSEALAFLDLVRHLHTIIRDTEDVSIKDVRGLSLGMGQRMMERLATAMSCYRQYVVNSRKLSDEDITGKNAAWLGSREKWEKAAEAKAAGSVEIEPPSVAGVDKSERRKVKGGGEVVVSHPSDVVQFLAALKNGQDIYVSDSVRSQVVVFLNALVAKLPEPGAAKDIASKVAEEAASKTASDAKADPKAASDAKADPKAASDAKAAPKAASDAKGTPKRGSAPKGERPAPSSVSAKPK